jgi:hypothetical protein
MPIFTSMNEKEVPDVAVELWANNVANPLKKALKAYVEEGKVDS